MHQKRFRTISPDPPPRDLKEAHTRLIELYSDETGLTTDLEFKDEDDFQDPNEYDSWRERALERLKHVRVQIKWLEKFERLHTK